MNDRETQEQLNERAVLRQLTEHPGWAIARGRLTDVVATLDSIATIPPNTPTDEVAVQVFARAAATVILTRWLTDIEAEAAGYADDVAAMKDEKPNPIIKHFN